MYSPDTLKRLNDEAVAAYQAKAAEDVCDFCDEPAVEVLPIYNPADALREPPVEGAYSTVAICQHHLEQGHFGDEVFTCPGCGELFIINHSWDVVAVQTDDGYYCQKCAAENLEGVRLIDCLEDLLNGKVGDWTRINSVPGKEKFWDGEYSDYSDFPGHTSLASLVRSIKDAAEEHGIDLQDTVYPIIDHGYQFSVSLAIYH